LLGQIFASQRNNVSIQAKLTFLSFQKLNLRVLMRAMDDRESKPAATLEVFGMGAPQ
jgi:hypothetical protein